jgi:hypothetical protein
VIKPWLQRWLGVWDDSATRLRLVGEYRALEGSRLLMADLCARNYVFSAGPDVDNLFAAGITEGRRRAVQEILDFARIDPRELGATVVRTPKQGGDDA